MQIAEIVNTWNEESLKMLYDNYYKALVGFSYTIVGTVEMAEDVVQEVFANMWQKKVIFESDARLKAYLYTAVHNSSLSSIKLKANNTRSISQIELSSPMVIDDQGEEVLYKEELYRQLFQAIDALPMRQRDIFLHIMEGRTNAEIAEAMGISINTVRSQRRRGMEILKASAGSDVFVLLLAISQQIIR